MSDIPSWRDRLDWTKERSPAARDRMKAMQEEIRDLRRELEKKQRPQKRLETMLAIARERWKFWQKLATYYRTKK